MEISRDYNSNQSTGTEFSRFAQEIIWLEK